MIITPQRKKIISAVLTIFTVGSLAGIGGGVISVINGNAFKAINNSTLTPKQNPIFYYSNVFNTTPQFYSNSTRVDSIEKGVYEITAIRIKTKGNATLVLSNDISFNFLDGSSIAKVSKYLTDISDFQIKSYPKVTKFMLILRLINL